MHPLKILVAPNGFKESMSAIEASRAITRGLMQVTKNVIIEETPLADGGSGTVDAIVGATGGKYFRSRVRGPRGTLVTARYGLLPDNRTAVIEMAASSGLALLSPKQRNPMLASSYGTGQLIRRAIERGARRIILGIGDSATVDGGIGALQALGVKILDGRGRPVGEGGAALEHIHSINIDSADQRLAETEILIASDVENPLLGLQGAARVFGPQKGATPSMVKKLERGLAKWERAIARKTGMRFFDYPGSGAAGGVAIGFLAFFGAKITPGSLLIIDYANLREKISSADLVITAEGSIDEQTLQGKTPARIAAEASKAGVPVIAFAARIGLESARLKKHGFRAVIPIIDRVITLEQARSSGPELLQAAAARTLSLFLLGKEFNK
jgi:glycerate 2-kinase